MIIKDFFLFNRLGYAVNDSKSNIKLDTLNDKRKDIVLIDSCRIKPMRVKICVGTIESDKCFVSVCSTEFNGDKQHLYVETRPISEMSDIKKIFHIIKETYKANINVRTTSKPNKKHSA